MRRPGEFRSAHVFLPESDDPVVWPLTRWSGQSESWREYDLFVRWGGRARLWAIATGLPVVAVLFILYGPDRRPSGEPWWIPTSVVAFICLPALTMVGIALRHLLRYGRARRREIDEGEVTHKNRIAAWVDYHGIGLGIAIVALVVALSAWLTLR